LSYAGIFAYWNTPDGIESVHTCSIRGRAVSMTRR